MNSQGSEKTGIEETVGRQLLKRYSKSSEKASNNQPQYCRGLTYNWKSVQGSSVW